MSKQRDAALDNLKGLLIISVVYVHFYDLLGQKTALLFTIRTLVLAVQMPLFLFLSGYFGKHAEKRRQAAWAEYLVPFLIFNTLYYLLRVSQTPDLKYGLFRPHNMYWFLLTLLIIRVLLPELLHIRHLLPLSIALALLAGGDKDIGRTLSLSRTICFLPFYLMGYYCTPAQMKRLRSIPIPVALVSALTGCFLSLWLTDTIKIEKEASHPFQLVNSYLKQGLNPWEGICFRLGIYIAAPLIAVLLIRAVRSRKGVFTRIGRGSMTVYLLHAFPMLVIVGRWENITKMICHVMPALKLVEEPGKLLYGIPQMILLVLYSFLVSWVLSSPVVVQTYDSFLAGLKRLLFRIPAEKTENPIGTMQET